MPDQSIEDRLALAELHIEMLFDMMNIPNRATEQRLRALEDYTVAELEDAKEWMLKTAVGAHKSMLAVRKEIGKRGDTQAQNNNYNRLVYLKHSPPVSPKSPE